MSESCTTEQIIKMVLGAVDKIMANHDQLSKLDSVVGDGDHGSAMQRVASAISQTIAENRNGSLKSLLEKVGWSVMGVDGGATGPLMGSFFSGMASAIQDSEVFDVNTLASMFSNGLGKVQKLTKAKLGDKTMIDALVPAVQRFKLVVGENGSIPGGLRQAADAAKEGAESTQNMRAKFGKARNLGDRTIGHVDPGAMSVAYIFTGFRDGF